ncbi:MAG: hypothetical protein HC828_12395 [Blastochloris sp.]|nr:hypothetical protein [Blastochloris sp.]
MLLSARYVRRAKRLWYCDNCGKLILEPHLYLYGAADVGDKPSGARLHLDCTAWPHPKILAARAIYEREAAADRAAWDVCRNDEPIRDTLPADYPPEAYLEVLDEQGP